MNTEGRIIFKGPCVCLTEKEMWEGKGNVEKQQRNPFKEMNAILLQQGERFGLGSNLLEEEEATRNRH